MKKIIVLFLSLTVIISSAFATSDYNQGYLDGYAASQNGERNEVQIMFGGEPWSQASLGNWEINYYVDSFGDDTDECYISNYDMLEGTFSNFATTNSDLLAFFLIDEDVSIQLFENGSSIVKSNRSNPISYLVNIKCEGEVYSFSASNHGDRLTIEEHDEFIELLKKEKPLSMSITEISGFFDSTYLLKDIETTGFNAAMKQLYYY